MIDVGKPATMRGFHVSVADVGNQMHLCHPLLSFEGDRTLYLADHLDWRNEPAALTVADPDQAAALGTLLPPTHERPISSGEGLVAVGAELVRAAAIVQIEFLESEIGFTRLDDPECWIGVAEPAVYTTLRGRLVKEARAVFDEALRYAVLRGCRLSEIGDAALFLMRKCGSLRRDDIAIRRLAGARQSRELDLYRRLLTRFSIELDAAERILDERVQRHIAAMRQTGLPTFVSDGLIGSRLDLKFKVASLGLVHRVDAKVYRKPIRDIGAAPNPYHVTRAKYTSDSVVERRVPSSELTLGSTPEVMQTPVWKADSDPKPNTFDVRSRKTHEGSPIDKEIWAGWGDPLGPSQQLLKVARTDHQEVV